MLTVKLNNGRFVLGRLVEGDKWPYQYSNRTQADRRATEVGGHVRQFAGRPFYIAMDVVDEVEAAAANTTRARSLGACAFVAGCACVPASDEVLMRTLADRQVGDSRTSVELAAWTEGWQHARDAAHSSDGATGCAS